VLETIDPRVRRTREALEQALGTLIELKEFEKISVQDIAEASGVNRATFYDHYPDKFALFESMVEARFNRLLKQRGVVFDGGCRSALEAIVQGVCDYLAATPGLDCVRRRQMEPHFESAVIAVLRKHVTCGLEQHPEQTTVPSGILAAAVSWAIYGAAKEWIRSPDRCRSEEIVGTVMSLVVPILNAKLMA
jgi:AcrR family transcriptional regulator